MVPARDTLRATAPALQSLNLPLVRLDSRAIFLNPDTLP